MKVLSISSDQPTMQLVAKNQATTSSNPKQKIAIPTMEGFTFERVDQISCMEAQGNYTLIHFADGRKQLVCRTLRDMENTLLKDARFVRVHRSHTVNLDYLQRYVKGKGGYLILETGMNISVSSGRKQAFLDALGLYFG